jgi:two-component system, LytTR family, sensor kinase
LPTSLINNVRFRFSFSIWWWSWAFTQAIIFNKLGLTWKVAIFDSSVTNLLLAATTLLIALSLQYYTPQKNKYGYILVLCAVLSLLWLFISHGLLLLIIGNEDNYDLFYDRSRVIRLAVGFLIIGCMALITVLWKTLQDQQETEKRKAEADQLSKEAELNNLRQQLQPHFLFNSLNSINALVSAQPSKARTMIHQLSDFLRGTLKKDQGQWITIEDELQHLQLYLEIEKVRFGHRLSADIENKADNMKIPPLLLQPIVENAIKFGLYDTTEDIIIKIEAKEEQKSLVLSVSNPFDPETANPKKGTGFGLSSVQRRLYLLFGRNDLVNTQAISNTFTTTIKIPQP